MKPAIVTVAVGIVLALLLSPTLVASRPQQEAPSTMTLTAPVTIGYVAEGRVHFKLGGTWQRRFVVVIDSDDRMKFPKGIERAYNGRLVQITGTVHTGDRMVEIQVTDPSQLFVVGTQPSPAPKRRSTAPADLSSLQQEIKKLQREVTALRQQPPTQTKTTSTPALEQEVRQLRQEVRSLHSEVNRLEDLLYTSMEIHHRRP